MKNVDLKSIYENMHKKGSSSWFSDGREERSIIIGMGEPWDGLRVLEVGCGEGDLSHAIGAVGVDYSQEAISSAVKKYADGLFICDDYRNIPMKSDQQYDRIVLQGVLEHLDDPFKELKWMIDNFKPGTVITSSPCFLNPRGIVWMTLDMLGAVMSKTDLHFLDPGQFQEFCDEHGYGLEMQWCDFDWGNGTGMMADLARRIRLALKDGGIPLENRKYVKFMEWLSRCNVTGMGATMVYKILTN